MYNVSAPNTERTRSLHAATDLWCVCGCGSWEVGFTHYDLSMNMQNNYPSLAYVFFFCVSMCCFSKKHQQDVDTSLATVYPPLLKTQNAYIHGPGEEGEPSPCHGQLPGILRQRDREKG